ncbi:MAG TPA: response regulator [Thermoanaerobaculia bacterium]|nr:response regulator [Thermoanaerobaculia bacterium]
MSRRILLADDSVTIQKVIELTFMDDDYEVRAVGNGDEALAMLTALTVDFVIADVHMPGASGYEVCRRSKQLRPEVPVLLLVGTFEPFDEAQARESGADSFLKKPFDSQELLGRVHELLGPAAAAGAATAAGAPQPAGVTAAPAAAATSVAPATPPPSAPLAPSAIGSASTVPEPAAAAPAGEALAATDGGPGKAVRLTGGVEAAATWQEFELDAEPELVADPWPDVPASPPAAANVPPAVHPFEQPFALGDLDEPAASAEPAKPAASAAPAPAADGARPSPPDWLPAAPAPPALAAAEAAERFDRPFTLGEPLDDRVLLDQAEAQEEEQKKESAGAPSPSLSGDEPALRATQEEPVTPETPAIQAIPATPEAPASAEPAERAAAAGNGQPAALPAADASEAANAGAAGLGDQDLDRIARRVVELIGDKVVRDIAWEVIPDLAEVVIKDRLRELESQIE